MKSPGSGGKGFSALGVPEAFVGKGPGRSGQTTVGGYEETARYFLLSLHSQSWSSSLEVQGTGIMGQRLGEKSVGWATRSLPLAFTLSVALSNGLRSWSGCLTLIPHVLARSEARGQVK